MTTLNELGERELIRRLAPLLPTRPDVAVGLGDDTAVARVEGSPFDLLLTTDALIEGRHFRADAPPELIGRKAVARALSDIAAMGGEPQFALIDLVAPGHERLARIEAAYRGAAALLARHGVALVGGDTSSGPVLEFHVFAVGRVPAGQALLRSGARVGDVIQVTGRLGGSSRGKHFEFEPRLAEGAWLREGGWATSLIDVSDGLATDLRHLAVAGGVSALLEATRLPISHDVASLQDGRTPVEHALFDGEDFELLFTVPAARQAEFARAWAARFPDLPCTAFGVITPGPPGIQLLDARGRAQELPDGGFEHFRRDGLRD